ncbi:hypothetical protein ACFOM8_01810 [Paracoccus angustae]|uniref:Uncharacterized protein n=1 Tax=Paracoccus angustae TaxID=1671480 RepID=A0ABV7TZN6_9RHOB
MSEALKRLIDAVDAEHTLTTQFADAFPSEGFHDAIHAYSGSLDDARSLMADLLPGWRMRIEQSEIVDHGDSFTACVWPNDYTRREQVFRPSGEASNPARAWLLAILRAKLAEADNPATKRTSPD